MSNFKKLIVASFLIALIVGCAGNPDAEIAARNVNRNSERTGNPYRWGVEDAPGLFNSVMSREIIGTPGPTAADEKLQKDILSAIQKAELAEGFENPKVLETRSVSQTPDETREVWVVSRGEKRIAYTVSMKPSPTGGTGLLIQGWE